MQALLKKKIFSLILAFAFSPLIVAAQLRGAFQETATKQPTGEELSQKHLYQEAIWRFEEEGKHEAAKRMADFLYAQLTKGDIPEGGINSLGMGGVTKPKAVTLPFGITGVFKSAYVRHPSSNYRSEIAAYLFDQLIGFRLVPMTVERTVNGQKGSLQYFIRNAHPALKVPSYRRSANLNAFDYLISNKDRNGENVLIAEGREIAIDHGLCLRGLNPLGRFLRANDKFRNLVGYHKDPVRQMIVHPRYDLEAFRAELHILNKLKTLALSDLQKALGKYLSPSKLRRIFNKKEKLLKALGE